MSTPTTARTAIVLQQIDARIAAIAGNWPDESRALRCLKTAIEGLLDAEGWIAAAQDDALCAEAYGRAERYREAWEDCVARLTSILDTWEAAK
jgi:hypothetical protein